MALTLADLLAPMEPERFFAEFHDKQPLHLKGAAAKFASVLSWRGIDRLLDQVGIWSDRSLRLQMDAQPVPPDAYCVRAASRDGAQGWQPDAAKLRDWVARGASLVLNDVETLTPGLAAVAHAIEDAGLGRAGANVYVSFQAHKAFPTHFDTHDVWAAQVEGEKVWNIWSGRADYPIAHPAFRSLGQAHHDRAKGALRERVTLRTGDLLYLPRGWYHDALAEGPASVHVAYGANAVIGVEFVQMLAERAIGDAAFRAPLPRQDGTAAAGFALTQRAAQLGQRLAEMARDPAVLAALARHVAEARFPRGSNHLLGARGWRRRATRPRPRGTPEGMPRRRPSGSSRPRPGRCGAAPTGC